MLFIKQKPLAVNGEEGRWSWQILYDNNEDLYEYVLTDPDDGGYSFDEVENYWFDAIVIFQEAWKDSAILER